jgi:hypothetical protein
MLFADSRRVKSATTENTEKDGTHGKKDGTHGKDEGR